MSQPGRISHVQFTDLPVDDLDRAIEFYTRVLGLRVARDEPYQEGWRSVEIEVPDARTRVLLVRRLSPGVADGPASDGSPALALIVDDVDAFHAAARAAGEAFARDPAQAPWSRELRYALVRDSEGNTVLVQSGLTERRSARSGLQATPASCPRGGSAP